MSQSESEVLADAVFQAVTQYIRNALASHTGKEREVVERMIRDSLGDLKDNLRNKEDLRELRDLQAKGETDRRIADLGKSLSKMLDRRIEQTKAEAAKEAARHAAVKAREVKKELLATVQIHSDEVQVVGWTPGHQWDGTKIRFEQEPGVWGPWVDVEGPRGRDGMNGGGGGMPRNLILDGGGAFDEHTTLNGGTASTVNQFAVGGGSANTRYDARVFNGGRAI
ncbi:hypothetical protein GCM10007320_61390 [Pseudorhodoferax aquiterrae]|uniref:Uncharacterized protein n=1 Tax=Pseudorhodoferax aquiterrae TaxID=747304 RepID=A0ABQ3GET6_9BURK|nr:hypothetical protein [Pseudorhodoferax aquiterrae]GHD02285.1 hypothetical protein GCM10007320_61390 [Pseudorhodoferax aquiterrae]